MEPEVIKHIASEISCIIGLVTVCGTIVALVFIRLYYTNEEDNRSKK